MASPSSMIMNSLMTHVDSGDIDGVKRLLNSECDISCSLDCFENTALHIAASRGHSEIVSALLASGGDVKAKNIHGDTAFTSSLKSGHLDVCRVLLEAGSELEPMDIWGLTPLMYAVRNKHTDIVDFLLSSTSCVNQINKGGQTALFVTCSEGLTDITDILLKAGAKADVKDTHGQTPLLLAVRKGHAGCVRVLLQHGTNPRQAAHSLYARRWVSLTPVQAAILSGRLDVVKMLWAAMACTEGELFRFVTDAAHNFSPEADVSEWLQKNIQSPLSLVNLCHRVISLTVGYTPGRVSRLKSLGLPAVVLNKLMLLDI